jgi:hypothetical protein
MARLQLMRENTEKIQELVRQVNVLAHEISEQVGLLEELVLSESGGSETLQ